MPKFQTVFLCGLRTQVFALWNLLGRTGGVLTSTLDITAKQRLREDLGASPEDIKLFQSFSTKKNRKKVINDLRSEKIDKVFPTYALFNKGIDIDTLTVAYFVAPTRSKTRVLQSRGRVVRKRLDGAGKFPKIVQIHDVEVSMLKYQGYHVQNLLRKANE